jgi:hypothetical protein
MSPRNSFDSEHALENTSDLFLDQILNESLKR